MSEKIQEQILKMSLDTNEFDKYAKQTIETLGKFEQQIDHLVKNNTVVDLGSKMLTGFKDVTDTIDKVGKKYSWLEQIAIGAYRKIGEAATGYLKNEVFKITGLSQATAGWQKYEQEVEAVQTIMNATDLNIETVEKHLKKLSWYTDETSYHYDDMVKNIAAFNSAGIKDLGKATNAMIGIANMAGYFGVNANKATHAMEGFAKAMGQSFMDNRAWSYVHTAQMDTAKIKQAFVDTAVELKKLKRTSKGTFETLAGHEFTYESFNTMLKDRWLDQEVMIKTFGKYSKSVDTIYKAWLDSGEMATVSSLIEEMGGSLDKTSIKALKASQETKTFTDAVGAFEEVVASGWRTTFKYLFGNYEEARDMWSGVVDELWDIFAGAGYKRNDLLRGWYEGGGRDEALKGIANLWHGFMAIVNPIKEAFDTIFPGTTVERLLKLTHAFEQFSEKFRSWFDFGFKKSKTDEMADDLGKMTEVTETFEDACERTRKNLDKLYDEVNKGKWGTMWDRWKALGEAGYVWQIVQNEVNKRYTEAGVGNYKNRYEVKDDGTLKYAKKTAKALEEEGDALNTMTAAQVLAMRRSENLTKTMMGLFSAVDIVKDIFVEAGKFIGSTFGKFVSGLSPTIDKILTVTAKWGDTIVQLRSKLSQSSIAEFFEKASTSVANWASTAVNKAIPAFIDGIGWIAKKIQALADLLYPFVKGAIGALLYVIKEIPGWISQAYKYIKPIAKSIIDGIGPTIEKVKNWLINDVYPFVKALPNTIGPFIKNAYDSGKKFVTDVYNRIIGSESLAKLKTSLNKAWGSIKTFGKQVWNYLKEIGGDAWDSISEFFSAYKTENGGLDWAKIFADALDFVMEKISSVITGIGDMMTRSKEYLNLFNDGSLTSGVQTLVANVGSTTENLDKFATNKLAPAKELIEKIMNWLSGIVGFLKDPIDYVTSSFKKIADSLTNFFTGLNLEKLASIFKDTGVGMFFAVLAKNMASGALSIASIPGAFASTMLALKDVFVAYSKSINAKAILNIAKAFGILTLSIIALASVPPDTLTNIVSYIAIIGLVSALLVRMLAMYEQFRKVTEKQKDTLQSFYMFEFKGDQVAAALVAPFREFLATLGLQIGKNLNKLNNSIRIIALAAGIATIAKQIIDIYNFITQVNSEGEDGKRKLYESIGFIVAIGAALAALSWLLGKQENNNSIGWALSFVTIALGLGIIIQVVKQIARWDVNIINNAWAAVGIATVALIGIAYALHLSQTKMMKLHNGSESKTSNHLISLALLLLTFAAALTLMAPAMLALGTLDFGSMMVAITMVVLFTSIVAAMGYVAKEIGDQAGNIVKGVAAIGAVILMCTLMFTVFTILGTLLKVQGVGTSLLYGLAALAGALSVVAVMAMLMEHTGATQALVKFAEATSKFGFGIIAASIAFMLFAQAAPVAIDAIVYLGQKLNDPATREALVHGFMAIGLAVLAAIILMKADIAQGIVSIFKAIFGALSENFGVMLGQLTGMITKVLNWITGNKFLLIGALVLLIALIFSFLDAIIPDVVDRLFKLVLIIVNSLAKTFLVRGPQIAEAILNVLKVIWNLVMRGIAALLENFASNRFGDAVGKKVGDMFRDMVLGEDGTKNLEKDIDDSIAKLQSEADRYEDSAVDTITKANKNIQTRTSGLNIGNVFGGITGGNSAMNNLVRGVPVSIKMDNGGFDLTSILGGGKENIYSSADEAFSAIPDAIKSNFGVAELDAESGMARINEILTVSGESTGNQVQEDVQQTVIGIEKTVDDGTAHIAKSLDENGETVVQEIDGVWADLAIKEDDGIKSHKDRMYNIYDPETQEQLRKRTQSYTTACLVDPMLITLDNAVTEVKKRANYIIDGFVSEVKSQYNLSRVWSAGSGVTAKFLGAMDHEAVIKSPSREAAWRGLMIVTGLVKGAMDNIGQVETAGASLASRMLGSVSSVLESTGNMSPTITPVLSMGNVASNLGTLNGLFGQAALSAALASDAFTGFSQNQEIKQAQIENFNMNNVDVVSQLQQLRGDVNNLNESFLGTQVVLDSGALVGATARQMDNALGRINTYRGRGI